MDLDEGEKEEYDDEESDEISVIILI